MKTSLIVCALGLVLTESSHALQVTYSSVPTTVIIPNGGIAESVLAVDDQITFIEDVNLHIKILGGDNPQLASLVYHGIDDLFPLGLLIDTGELTGSGLDIWLDNDAVLSLAEFDPSALPGTRYKPSDPLALSIFNGYTANVDWKLLLEDSGDAGGSPEQGVFLQWELEISGTKAAVPDALPGVIPAVSLFGLVAADAMRRRMKR